MLARAADRLDVALVGTAAAAEHVDVGVTLAQRAILRAQLDWISVVEGATMFLRLPQRGKGAGRRRPQDFWVVPPAFALRVAGQPWAPTGHVRRCIARGQKSRSFAGPDLDQIDVRPSPTCAEQPRLSCSPPRTDTATFVRIEMLQPSPTCQSCSSPRSCHSLPAPSARTRRKFLSPERPPSTLHGCPAAHSQRMC